MSRLQEPYAGPGSDTPSTRSEPRRRGALPLSAARERLGVSLAAPPEAVTSQWEPLPSFRFGNTLLAALLLAAAAPLMVLIAVAIKLTSPGPAIYKQSRVGLDRRNGRRRYLGNRRRSDLGGRPFDIYKFRTMYDGSGPRSRQVWTRPNDRRVTPLGRFLRLYRMDELPQTINVLKGEMNVVGPRPEQPAIFARLRERFERFPERQLVPPGITGLAQVRCGYGGTTADVRRKLDCDLEYLKHRSVWLDLWILLKTVPVVLTRQGAR